MSHSKFIKVFLGLSLIGTAFCSQPAPTSQAPKTGVEPYTVRIRFDGVPPDVFISAGMTCTVVMKEGAAPTAGLGIKKVLAAIF